MKTLFIVLAVAWLFLLFVPQKVVADTIDLGTDNANNWSVTVGGGGGGTPFSLSIINVFYPARGIPEPCISITSTETANGQWIAGSSNGTFNGLWYADETFTLPVGATNVSLSFSDLYADDRVVLELNGAVSGDYFLNTQPGSGEMSFPPGPPNYQWF